MRTRLIALTIGLGLAVTLAACGSDDTADDAAAPTEAQSAAPAEEAIITIEGFAFDGPTTVAPGSTITVTNADGAPHTLTFANNEVDTGELGQGDSVTVTAPTTPGTYDFFCQIHPSMTGQIVVAG